MKIRPPFPELPIFNVNAVILTFFGFKHQVKELLLYLSHSTLIYFKKHGKILDGFLLTWSPKVYGELVFKTSIDCECNNAFPEWPADLRQYPNNKRVKL